MAIRIKTFIHDHIYRPLLMAILIFLSLFCLSSCSGGSEVENVAWVGDVNISLEEFELTYQFNPYLSRIQNTEQAKVTHLQTLIAEKMIAQEGYRKGYDEKSQIQALREQYKREALIESLWQSEIKEKIAVSETEVYEAYLKSKRTRHFKYLIFPDEQLAERAYLHLKNGINFSEVAQMNGLDPEMIPEDSISFGSSLNSLETYIFQLNLNETGNPIKIGQYYFVIKHIDDSVDIFTSADDFEKQYAHIEKIIRSREQISAFQKYIRNRYDAPPYILNKQVFKVLVQKLEDLLEINVNSQGKILPEVANVKLGETAEQFGDFRNTTVVDFKGDNQWTINTLLTRLQISPYPLTFSSPSKFRSSMIAATKMILDDQVLVMLAKNADLEESNFVLSQSHMWTDYLVFLELLRDFGSLSNSKDADETVLQMDARLDNYLVDLSRKYDIVINKALFDTLAPLKSDMVVIKTHFPQRVIAPVLIPLNNVPKFQQIISSKLIQN